MKRLAVILLLAACGGQPGDPAPGARADFIDLTGDDIGTAFLEQQPDGVVRLRVEIEGLTAGEHGFHVHQVGRCETPFQSAGAHFNPSNRKHGAQNPEGPHAGDLPNLRAADATVTRLETLLRDVTLESLLDADGSALIIHAKPDDYKTDPSGNSGDRIACAVIRRP
jgi:Cu-Zn family superoxide dismutase